MDYDHFTLPDHFTSSNPINIITVTRLALYILSKTNLSKINKDFTFNPPPKKNKYLMVVLSKWYH